MRKLIVIALVLLLLFSSVVFIQPSRARRLSPYAAARGEIIIKFKEQVFQPSTLERGANLAETITTQGASLQATDRRQRDDAWDERLGEYAKIVSTIGGGQGVGTMQPLLPFDPATLPAEAEVTTASASARVKHLISRYGFERIAIAEFGVDTDIAPLLAKLRAHEAVEYAEPNYPVDLGSVLPSDPKFSEQWALRNLGIGVGGYPATLNSDIKATEAWALTTGNPDVLIAVTDTGIDMRHPDLAPNIYTNPGEIPDNNIDDDNNGYVDDVHGFNVADRNNDISDVSGHGSEMSGIIAAKMGNGIGISGVSQSKILPVRFFRRTGAGQLDFRGTIAWAARALLYSIAAGADIINASWSQVSVGDEELQTLRDAIAATNEAGILLVCIAGNQGVNIDFFRLYPAAIGSPNQVVVTASEFNDDLWHPPFDPFNFKAGFGAGTVDLAAPGVTILTTTAHGDCLECAPSENPDDWYRVIDGSSASAAYVSGVAALIKSHHPQADAATIKRRLLESVERRPQLQHLVRTGGRLNALGALMIDLPVTPPVLTRLKIKGSGKTFIFGDNLKDGAELLIGEARFPARVKNGDLSRLVTNLPLATLPVGAPFEVRLRNPDGGISAPLTITR